jgi:hypothetical protein
VTLAALQIGKSRSVSRFRRWRAMTRDHGDLSLALSLTWSWTFTPWYTSNLTSPDLTEPHRTRISTGDFSSVQNLKCAGLCGPVRSEQLYICYTDPPLERTQMTQPPHWISCTHCGCAYNWCSGGQDCPHQHAMQSDGRPRDSFNRHASIGVCSKLCVVERAEGSRAAIFVIREPLEN